MEFVSKTINTFRNYPINNDYSKTSTMNRKFDSNFNIVAINGSLDAVTSEQAKQEILAKMTRSDSVFIDMSGCRHISNYGIYFLSMLMTKAKLLNVKLVFISIIDEISELLSLTGIIENMESAPSIEAALRKYALN